MAFTTEFVMGAGGSVEEIPVSMSGSGGSSSNPTAHPLTTVDAGDGATIVLTGTLDPASTSTNGRPHVQIGTLIHSDPSPFLIGPGAVGVGGFFTGVVDVSVLSRTLTTTSFTGTVYVARL